MPDGVVRIGDRATFQAFRTSARRSRRGPVGVAFVPSPPGDRRIRVAFAVGRRTGNAVARNRLRRRLRAVMRELASTGRLPTGAFLLSVAPGADRLSHAQLVEAVDRAVAAATGPEQPR